jgi:phage protein U
MSNVMMTLGDFQFGIATAAFQELDRVTEWRWASQDRFLQLPALQYVGPGGDTISLPGVIYPEYRGGLGQLDAMRAQANKGVPLTMVSGTGTVMGRWVIERLEDKQSIFAEQGVGRKQEFTLALRKFDDPSSSTGAASMVSASSMTAALPPLAGLQSVTSSSGSTFASIASSISSSIAAVQGQAASIGTTVNSILKPMNQAMGAATGLASSIADAKRLLGTIPTTISGKASARSLLNAANSAVMNSSAAGSALKSAYADLTTVGTSTQALTAVQGGLISVNKLTVQATALQQQASTLLAGLGG